MRWTIVVGSAEADEAPAAPEGETVVMDVRRSVGPPHDGQNFFVGSLQSLGKGMRDDQWSVRRARKRERPHLKQAWHRRTQLRMLRIRRPSPPTRLSPIWMRTFWTAKSEVMQALLRIALGRACFAAFFFARFDSPTTTGVLPLFPSSGRARPRSRALWVWMLEGVTQAPSSSSSGSSSSERGSSSYPGIEVKVAV